MLRLYSIVDSRSGSTTYFFAENDGIAKRQFLMSVCQSPFWKDFELYNTAINLVSTVEFDSDVMDFIVDDPEQDLVVSYQVNVTQEEIDSYSYAIERSNQVRSRAYAETHKKKESSDEN